MVIIPILSFVLWGWMIGWASAPYDPYWAQHNRKKAALMALAGPTTNLLLVIIAAIAIRGGMLFGVFYAPQSITFEHVTEAEAPGFANAIAVVISILFSLNPASSRRQQCALALSKRPSSRTLFADDAPAKSENHRTGHCLAAHRSSA